MIRIHVKAVARAINASVPVGAVPQGRHVVVTRAVHQMATVAVTHAVTQTFPVAVTHAVVYFRLRELLHLRHRTAAPPGLRLAVSQTAAG